METQPRLFYSSLPFFPSFFPGPSGTTVKQWHHCNIPANNVSRLAPSVFSEMEKDLTHRSWKTEKKRYSKTIFLLFFLSFPSRRAHACDLQKHKHKLQSPPASHESIRLAKLQFYLRSGVVHLTWERETGRSCFLIVFSILQSAPQVAGTC